MLGGGGGVGRKWVRCVRRGRRGWKEVGKVNLGVLGGEEGLEGSG